MSRSKSKPVGSPTLPPVVTFVDAMSQLMAFEEEFGCCQAALIVDAAGTVLDGCVLTKKSHTADHALTYVLLGEHLPGRPCNVLLFSVMGKADISVLGESDVDAYGALAARCQDAGAHLADWLIAGGEQYRSMQLALAAEPLEGWTLNVEKEV